MPTNKTTIKIQVGANAPRDYPGPPESGNPTLRSNFATGVSAGNVRHSIETTKNKMWDWVITFDNFTTAEKLDFEDMFYNEARGPINAFSMEWTNGQIYQECRFVSTSLEWQRRGPNCWGARIAIETSTQPDSRVP